MITFDLKFTAGSDFENVTQELTFRPATPTLSECVNITIFQDSAVENSVEFFSVSAETSSGIITLSPATRTVIIQEDGDRK